MTIKQYALLIIAGLAVGTCSYAERRDALDEVKEKADARYCEMRQLWESSNGQYGWPAYNEDLEPSCDLTKGGDE